MKIVKVKNTDTNLELPAEVRVYTPNQVVVLIKEFETAKLFRQEMTSEDGVNWTTDDGVYTCEIAKDMFEYDKGTILVRVPKTKVVDL
jgi:hypothetical protein